MITRAGPRIFVSAGEPSGDLHGAGVVRALRQRMGYCLQGGGLFPHLSAADNVLLLPRHLGWKGPRSAAGRSRKYSSPAR